MLYSTFRGNKATVWGSQQESVAEQDCINAKTGIITKSSGLVVSTQHCWLAASPDGLVYDSQSTDPYGIVEYKNPYGVCDLSLTEAAQSKQFFISTDGDSGKLHLKTSHSYYYQIQAAMFCTQRKWCDFVVRTSVDLHIERIKWNDKFWDGIVPKLKRFYFEALLPELAQPLYQSGGI